MPRQGEGKRRAFLDQATVRGLPVPETGAVLYLDTEVPGFCVQVSSGGAKTFRMRYRKRAQGSPRPKWFSVQIGRFQDSTRARAMPGVTAMDPRKVGVTAIEARKAAVALRNAIDSGDNPALEQKVRRAAIATKAAQATTLEQAYQLYLSYIQARRNPMRASSVEKVRGSFELHVLPTLGERPLSSLTRGDVAELARRVSVPRRRRGRKVGGPVAANRVIAHISAFFTWATKQDPVLIQSNVAREIDRGEVLEREHARERYLSGAEWAALMTELDDRPYRAVRGSRFAPTREVRLDAPNARTLVSCEAIRVSLLTGARKGEVFQMRWADVDLEARWWRKPKETTKGGRVHEVAIPQVAVEALRRVRAAHADPVWVFPGKLRLDKLGQGQIPKANEGGPVTDVHDLWGRIRADLGMHDVRHHDLRHTAASVLISNGASLYDVGAMLGHRQAQTTMRYSHLLQDAKHKLASTMDAFAASAGAGSASSRPNRAR